MYKATTLLSRLLQISRLDQTDLNVYDRPWSTLAANALPRIGALLYGYSLIIAKNFVTVYTAFDY